jgi:heme/copper-type cytochrome/quinol oxidase subunit 2
MEDAYFRSVATRLCGASHVNREAQVTADSPNAFQVTCTIEKLQQTKSWLQQVENEQSTESLIAASKPDHNATQPQRDETESKRRPCSKGITLGALLGVSGGCKD